MLEGKVSTFFKYIGSHTIWIYFWHIPFVEFFTYTNSDMHYMAKFAIAMSAAFLIVFFARAIDTQLEHYEWQDSKMAQYSIYRLISLA